MSTPAPYNSELLAVLINAHAGSLPISHGHALEIIAALNGANHWNDIAGHSDAVRFKREAKRLRVYLQRPDISLPLSAEGARAILTAFVEELPVASPKAKEPRMHSMQALLPTFVAKAKFDERFYLGFLESHPMRPEKAHSSRSIEDREWLNELSSLQGKVAAYTRKVTGYLNTHGGPFEFYAGPIMIPKDQTLEDMTEARVDIFCRSADGILRQIAFLDLRAPDDELGWAWCPAFSNEPTKLPRKSALLGKTDEFLDVLKLIDEHLGYAVESYPLTGVNGDASSLDGPLNTVMRMVRGN